MSCDEFELQHGLRLILTLYYGIEIHLIHSLRGWFVFFVFLGFSMKTTDQMVLLVYMTYTTLFSLMNEFGFFTRCFKSMPMSPRLPMIKVLSKTYTF